MVCPHCKKTIPENSVFCPECGQSLADKRQSADVERFWDIVQRENERVEQFRKDKLNKELRLRKNQRLGVVFVIVTVLVIGVVITFLYNRNDNTQNPTTTEQMGITTEKGAGMNGDSDEDSTDKTDTKQENSKISEAYLETFEIIDSGEYQGNEGDSFVYSIGQHQYTRGNKDINGKSYQHGLEAWIARWNYEEESSWAYATYDIGEGYSGLRGEVVIIDSYNTDHFKSTLSFYDAASEKLLASYELSPEKIPFEFEVNIENVNSLKILVSDNQAVSGGTSFGLVNIILNHEKYE